MKATEQYFPVVLFVTLYKVVLTFESVDKILWCDNLNEGWWEVLPHDTVYYSAFTKMKFGFFCRIFHLVTLGEWKGLPKSTTQRTKLRPFIREKTSRRGLHNIWQDANTPYKLYKVTGYVHGLFNPRLASAAACPGRGVLGYVYPSRSLP